MAEEKYEQETREKCAEIVSLLVKMEAAFSSETSLKFCRRTLQ
jgi:hypothetical protein